MNVLNYRIVIEPDEQTGSKKHRFTAYCPTLGVADDGSTVEEALANVKDAIEAYVQSLVDDKQPVPVDYTQKDIVTTTQVNIRGNVQLA